MTDACLLPELVSRSARKALCRFVWKRNDSQPPSGATPADQLRAGGLRALRALSRAGEARRIAPLTGYETLIRSRAWGWLLSFTVRLRAHPAERTSPPSGAVQGVEAPEGLRGIRLFGAVTTGNDITPQTYAWVGPDRLLPYRGIQQRFSSITESAIEAYTNASPDRMKWSSFGTTIGDVQIFKNLLECPPC